MARYIDADKVMEEISRIGGNNHCEWDTLCVRALISRQPTADVAPRSKVQRLKKLNRRIKKTLKNIVLQLEAEIEGADKYIREYDSSEVQIAYNKGIKYAFKIVKELIEKGGEG